MQRGLLSLKLRQCCLDDADLAQLIGTCHQSTLLQLDLCHDEFQYDEKSSNLIKLCKSLNNVLHLCIVDCGIESWPSNVSVSVILINNSNQLYKEVFYLFIGKVEACEEEYILSTGNLIRQTNLVTSDGLPSHMQTHSLDRPYK